MDLCKKTCNDDGSSFMTYKSSTSTKDEQNCRCSKSCDAPGKYSTSICAADVYSKGTWFEDLRLIKQLKF